MNKHTYLTYLIDVFCQRHLFNGVMHVGVEQIICKCPRYSLNYKIKTSKSKHIKTIFNIK